MAAPANPSSSGSLSVRFASCTCNCSSSSRGSLRLSLPAAPARGRGAEEARVPGPGFRLLCTGASIESILLKVALLRRRCASHSGTFEAAKGKRQGTSELDVPGADPKRCEVRR